MISPKSIVITGASAGIGAALATAYASPGRRMLLIARRADALETLAETLRDAGAEVEIAALGVDDQAGMATAITQFDNAGPVDLVIANAGVTAGLGPDNTPEDPADTRWMINVNLIGVMNAVEPLIPRFQKRGAGQIAMMSSIAAVRPHTNLQGYSACKAAVRAWGVALRGWLHPQGVDVCVITPGFVTSDMSARHHGPRPFEISAEKAARIIKSGLARRETMITFPWQLALLVWLGNRLPPLMSDWFDRGYTARIEPDPRKTMGHKQD
ncbi:MAG: SDR family NAD(P)-dependent oxidoreductase [Pikeienuella sp.]